MPLSAAPVSAAMAIHSDARPQAASTTNNSWSPKAKAMFCLMAQTCAWLPIQYGLPATIPSDPRLIGVHGKPGLRGLSPSHLVSRGYFLDDPYLAGRAVGTVWPL